MKLLDLHLLAYGPFTDRHLDLSAGNEGLHIVFGPNEAGKSSALRALRALLYGVPERTQDDFVHGKTELRVGGLFRGADGTELHCYRRKGRKNTLLDANGDPVAENELARLLGGVDERLFQRLFGIDHDALVSGGQALLDERGREAEALFGTGLGSTAVHALLQDLEQEAQSLFAPSGRASKPSINAALSGLAAIEREQRDVSLSARQWDTARKAVNADKTRLKEMDGQLAEAVKRQSTLERIRRTLPGLAKRAQLREQLAALGDVPMLADDFGSRREAAVSKRRIAAEGRSKAAVRVETLRKKAGVLEVSEPLLAEADTIDELREQLGSYRKAARDRPGLVAKRTLLEEQARQRLAEIRRDPGLDEIDQVRPMLASRRRSTELGGSREALKSTVQKVRGRLAEAEGRLTAKREELGHQPQAVSHEALQQVVRETRPAGDVDSSIEGAKANLRRHEEACGRDLAVLGLWTGSVADLVRAPLPGEGTLRRFGEAFQAIENEQHQLEQAISEARTEQHRTEEALRAVLLAGAVPSEGDLQKARERRDDGWRLLRRQWLDGEDIAVQAQSYGDGKPLPDAFEEEIATTDEMSDRLRRESQAVHEKAADQAKLESCRKRISDAEAGLEGVADRRQELEQSWQELWVACGISPLPPREMVVWVGKASLLRDKVERGDELREKVEDLRRVRDTHLGSLGRALAACGESKPGDVELTDLKGLLEHAESRLRSLESAERRRSALEEAVAELEDSVRRLNREAKSAEKELASWASMWATLMGELGLGESATPGEVSDYLQGISDTLNLVNEGKELQLRIDGIDREAQVFEEGTKDLVGRLAPDLLGRPVGESALQLHARLGEQRASKSRLDELNMQRRQAEAEVSEAGSVIHAADEDLADLCRQAGCESSEQLQAVEQCFRKHQQFSEQLRDVERELVEGGGGFSIDALEVEAGAVDRDSVIAELAALCERIDQELRPERETLLEHKVGTERDFEAMAGSDGASVLAEKAQQTLSGLRGHAERYVRVRLAARVLRDEIEHFRRQHRDPILTRASGHFEKLTCGSLTAIETDFDESDQPVLVGVRPAGERLRVEAMSAGTRDQLYLALRLATLDHYVENSESLPFIVDDVLIQFDDERARATLGALADHAAKSQVILFTHHGRVAEEASRLEEATGRVFVHELG